MSLRRVTVKNFITTGMIEGKLSKENREKVVELEVPTKWLSI